MTWICVQIVSNGKESLDRLTALGRKVFAVKKAAMPKAKPKKRKTR